MVKTEWPPPEDNKRKLQKMKRSCGMNFITWRPTTTVHFSAVHGSGVTHTGKTSGADTWSTGRTSNQLTSDWWLHKPSEKRLPEETLLHKAKSTGGKASSMKWSRRTKCKSFPSPGIPGPPRAEGRLIMSILVSWKWCHKTPRIHSTLKTLWTTTLHSLKNQTQLVGMVITQDQLFQVLVTSPETKKFFFSKFI